MNLIDATVTKVLSGVYKNYNKFWVKVERDDIGGKSETTLMFDTLGDALAVKVGYKFQHLKNNESWKQNSK